MVSYNYILLVALFDIVLNQTYDLELVLVFHYNNRYPHILKRFDLDSILHLFHYHKHNIHRCMLDVL